MKKKEFSFWGHGAVATWKIRTQFSKVPVCVCIRERTCRECVKLSRKLNSLSEFFSLYQNHFFSLMCFLMWIFAIWRAQDEKKKSVEYTLIRDTFSRHTWEGYTQELLEIQIKTRKKNGWRGGQQLYELSEIDKLQYDKSVC